MLVLSSAGLSGCQRTPTLQEPAVADPPTIEQLERVGNTRLARRDYEGALRAYDEALRRGSHDVGVYYRAGVALSYLGRREEAIATMQWVARYGAPERDEVRIARRWLKSAGLEGADVLPGGSVSR
jgi:tetratricopeptide (TPR) repeat protein